MPNIVTSLPLDVEDLSDTLKIVFVGAHTPNRVELRRICGVSRLKIRNALLWLKNHNDMYRMIPSKSDTIVHLMIISPLSVVNEANINKLPDDDVPECIWATIERIENVADGDAERVGFTGDPLLDAVAQDEPNVTNIFPINTR